ncbi:fimbrillin family protein [Bacteroides fragilis]
MDNKILNKWIFGVALLLLAACTQDELAEQGDTLPEGMYPLEISSATLSAEVGSQPWGAGAPQTRVSENPDRNSSKWDGGEVITVQLGNNETTTTYEVQTDGSPELTGDRLYWAKREDNVTAWYPGNGTIDLSDQSGGLAYVLKATADNASCEKPVVLDFSHQLAKIRVKLTGEKAGDVNDVKIESYTSCTNTNGTVSTNGASIGEIDMYKVDEETFEANVVPGKAIEKFKVNDGDWVNLSTPVTPVAGNYHEIQINAGSKAVTITGDYTVEGEHKPLIINGNGIVTFKDARVTSDDLPVIQINDGCSPTLVFERTNVLKGNITSGEEDEYSIQLKNGAKLAVISEGIAIGSIHKRIELKISGNGEMWVQSDGNNSPAIIVKNGSLCISDGVDLTAVAADKWYAAMVDYIPAIGRSLYVSNVKGGTITLSDCTLKLYAWANSGDPEHWVTLENGTVTPNVDSALKSAKWDTEVSLDNKVKVKKLKDRPTLPDWAK